jgi:regulator of RNase E activity RraA
MSRSTGQAEPLARELLVALSQVSTATLTTQLFKRGLRNTFLFGLRPLNPGAARFVGEAFTLRYIPAREDLDTLQVFRDPEHPQRRAIEAIGPGQALVMDTRGEGRAASAGDILLTRLAVRGAVGVVTDGSFRDSRAIGSMNLPAFCGSVSATTNLALHHAVDMQVPIGCAGVPIYPGDVLVGDEEGVVCIPRHLASEVAQDAVAQEDLEAFIKDRVAAGSPLPGTYPPGERVLAAYEAQRSTAPADEARSTLPPTGGAAETEDAL